MVESNTKLGQRCGIVIPTEYRRKTSLEAGDEVVMHLDEDGCTSTLVRAQAIARAQALVRRYIPEGRSLSEELVSERREEATRGEVVLYASIFPGTAKQRARTRIDSSDHPQRGHRCGKPLGGGGEIGR